MNDEIPKGERWHHGWCYCSLWEKSPETLEKQGVPKGYCGKCIRTMILHPSGAIGMFLWGAIVVGIIIALMIKLRL